MASSDSIQQETEIWKALGFIMLCLVVMLACMVAFLFAWPFYSFIAALVLAAWAIAICRRRARPGAAVAFYWLGVAFSLGWSIGGLVYEHGLSTALATIGRQPTVAFARVWFLRGCWTGAGVVVGSAALLALIRSRRLSGGEVAIYALGSIGALAVAGFAQFDM